MVSGRTYSPRRLGFGELVETLVREHEVMRACLERARGAANAGDFEGVRRALNELDPVFRQHIADEESQILGLLISKLGVEGAESEIQVFRQHRPIYQLMNRVQELAAKSSLQLEASQGELQSLFEGHTLAEESAVFPKAASVRRGVDLNH